MRLAKDTPEGLDREQKEREGRNKKTVAEAIRECHELLTHISRDCVHVEHRVITKNAFKTKVIFSLIKKHQKATRSRCAARTCVA